MATQFVIMFNDFPEEVCPLGTTGEQADARAKEIKEAYVAKCKRNDPSYTGSTCYVRAREVRVTLPTLHIECETVCGGIKGSTSLNVVRVEQNDDGSLTAVTDHWPER